MITRLLSQFIATSTYSGLDAGTVKAAKRGVLDFLSVTLAGSQEDAAAILTRHVERTKAAGHATVIGRRFKTDAALAAYVNGTMAHALDYDDVIHVDDMWLGHPSVVILPAALALVEAGQLSGRDLIVAYCVGMDVYAKLGVLCGDVPYKNGWHNTSFIGNMAAAAAVSKLLGLDEGGVRRCLGIAASQSSGLRQNFGTMTKPLHAGMASRNGVEAALLASAGFTASESILEAPLGFRGVFTGEHIDLSEELPYGAQRISPEEFARRLGNPWSIAAPGPSFKTCPSCRATHFGMEAALEYRRKADTPVGEIVQVDCHVPEHMGSVLSYHDPSKGLEAKFSLEYVIARTLLDGTPRISDFTDERVNEPAIKPLMARIKWMPFSPRAGAFGTPEFVFRTNDRNVFRSRVEHPAGDPENPVSDAALLEKFHDCAAGVLSRDSRLRLADAISRLEALERLHDVTRLLE